MTGRAFAIFLLIGVVLLGWSAAAHRGYIRDTRASLQEASTVVNTRLGPIEYAYTGTKGPFIFFVHGTPGGFDLSARLRLKLSADGFRSIAPSRPGYLRTPLSVGRTPTEQAEAFVALLDAMGAKQALVVGFSGGGPSALELALRHPERVSGLVTIAALTQPVPAPEEPGTMFWLANTEIGGWVHHGLVSGNAEAVAAFIEPDPRLRAQILSNPNAVAAAGEAVDSLLTLPADRWEGRQNDLATFAELPTYPVATLSVPVLVIHGDSDTLVPLDHGRFLAEGAPRAEIWVVKGAGHSVLVSHELEILARIAAFARKHDTSN